MHIDEVLIQQQLDDLLDIPDWYRAIVLAQLPPKLCFALYKATRKRGDTELRHRLQGRTEEDMVRIDLPNSAMDQLEVALLEQLSSTAEHCSFKLLFCQVKFLYGEVSSIINLLRSLSGDLAKSKKKGRGARHPDSKAAPAAAEPTEQMHPRTAAEQAMEPPDNFEVPQKTAAVYVPMRTGDSFEQSGSNSQVHNR